MTTTINPVLLEAVESLSLPLDSPQWAELSHAYGPATETPTYLKALAKNGSEQRAILDQLWSTLCHQGTVYTASFAAVPHLVEIARNLPKEDGLQLIILVAMIERGRAVHNGATLPKAFETVYFASLELLGEVILDCLRKNWNELDYKWLFISLATIRGEVNLGWAIDFLDKHIQCPICESELVMDNYHIADVVIKREGIREFRDNGLGYLQWCEDHPLGFIVRVPLDSVPLQYVLHRVGCRELQTEITGKYMNVCYMDSNLIHTWFYRHGINIRGNVRCQFCFES
jgi:hypothetical protein